MSFFDTLQTTLKRVSEMKRFCFMCYLAIGLFIMSFSACGPTVRTNVVDFRQSEWPGVIASTQGLSIAEAGGAWSNGDVVTINFAQPLPKSFKVHLIAKAFGPNIGKNFAARIGNETAVFALKEKRREITIKLNNHVALSSISFDVPQPTSPLEWGESVDTRKLGIHFVELWIEPLR